MYKMSKEHYFSKFSAASVPNDVEFYWSIIPGLVEFDAPFRPDAPLIFLIAIQIAAQTELAWIMNRVQQKFYIRAAKWKKIIIFFPGLLVECNLKNYNQV